MKNRRIAIIRVLLLVIGLIIAHLGVTLFLVSDLGADPFNVLIQGLHKTISPIVPRGLLDLLKPVMPEGLTHGITHMAVCILLVIIFLFTARSYIRIGTVICMFLGGPIIDVFNVLLDPLAIGSFSLAGKIAVLALGCVILAFGMTIVIRSEAGTGPNDLVALIISEKKHWRFGIVRVIVDGTFILTGCLLGGVCNVGTIICAFLVGPVADFFLPFSGRIVSHFVGAPSTPASGG